MKRKRELGEIDEVRTDQVKTKEVPPGKDLSKQQEEMSKSYFDMEMWIEFRDKFCKLSDVYQACSQTHLKRYSVDPICSSFLTLLSRSFYFPKKNPRTGAVYSPFLSKELEQLFQRLRIDDDEGKESKNAEGFRDLLLGILRQLEGKIVKERESEIWDMPWEESLEMRNHAGLILDSKKPLKTLTPTGLSNYYLALRSLPCNFANVPIYLGLLWKEFYGDLGIQWFFFLLFASRLSTMIFPPLPDCVAGFCLSRITANSQVPGINDEVVLLHQIKEERGKVQSHEV